MNRKGLFGLGVTAVVLLFMNEFGFAEELEEELLRYLKSDKLDLFGREFEKILFQHTKEVSNPPYWDDAELKEKLKFIIEDIKTLPLQVRCIWKMLNQKPNTIAYGSLGYASWLKTSLGAEAFNKLILKLLKLIIK